MGTYGVTHKELSFFIILLGIVYAAFVAGYMSVTYYIPLLLLVFLSFVSFILKRKEIYFLWSIVAPRITGSAPILSNLLWLAREEGGGDGGLNDLFRLDIPFMKPMFFLFKPTYLKRVLSTEANNFPTRGYTGVVTKLVGDGNNILLSEGSPNAHWARFREVTAGINKDRIGEKSTIATMFGESWKACQELTHLFDNKRGCSLDLFFELFNVMVPAHNRALFGEEFAQKHTYKTLGEDMYHIITENGKQLKFPYTSPMREKTMMEQIKRVTSSVLKMAGESKSPFIAPWHDAVKQGLLSEQEFKSNLLVFEYAQAPLHVVFWALYMLSLHPEVEKKVVSEISTVLGREGMGADVITPLSHARLGDFKYLSKVITETLRLFPGVGLMQLRFPKTDCLFGSHFVPEGSYVFLSPYMIHRNASFWENPDEFDPLRPSLDTSNTGEELIHIPFGYGPRQCQGQYFAQDFVKATLISLLQHHEIHLVSGQPEVIPTEIGFCRPSRPVYFTFSERNLPPVSPFIKSVTSPGVFSPLSTRSPGVRSPYSSPKITKKSVSESEEEQLVVRVRDKGRRASLISTNSLDGAASDVKKEETPKPYAKLPTSTPILTPYPTTVEISDRNKAKFEIEKEEPLLKALVKRRCSIIRSPTLTKRVAIATNPGNGDMTARTRSPVRRRSVTTVLGMPTYSNAKNVRNQSKVASLRYRSLVFKESFKSVGKLSKNSSSATRESELLILWGSQAGRSHSFALRIAHMAKLCRIPATCLCMDLFDVTTMPKYGTVVVITSTYGDGGPPENAAKMSAWLEGDHPSDLWCGVNFAVLALGSTIYTRPFEFGYFVSRRFKELGAHQLIDEGILDEQKYNDSEEFRHWSLRFFEAMTSPRSGHRKSMQQALLVGRNKILGFQKFDFNLLNPPFELSFYNEYLDMEERMNQTGDVILATVGKNEKVTTDPTNDIFSIQLNFPENSAVEFQPGDNISVLPTNDIDIVRKLIARLRFSGKQVFNVEGAFLDDSVSLSCSKGMKKCTLEIALSYFYDITHSPSKTMLQFFALNCTSENDQQVLLDFSSNFPSFSQLEYTPLDILEMFPSIQICTPNATTTSAANTRNLAIFLGLLNNMQVRLYSISNSPLVHSSSARLVYKVVDYVSKAGQAKRGVCSNWLKSQTLGNKIAIALSRSKFRLPNSAATPIIMVSAGTGISPFLGFLEHKLATQKDDNVCGKTVLIHGCRSEEDFPHRNIVQNAIDGSILTDVWTAYSRLEGTKYNYIQNILEDKAQDLWKYMQEGAIMYSCGNIKIGTSVRANLVTLAKNCHGFDDIQAKAWVQQLSSTGKLRHDEWGMSPE